jgi:organic hydroperoxide reductase OsmC/OhrA
MAPGNAWSPETSLVAAVADCFILTFRGVAQAAKFPWESLEWTSPNQQSQSDDALTENRDDHCVLKLIR